MADTSDLQQVEEVDDEEEDEISEAGQGVNEKKRRKRWIFGFLGSRRNTDDIFFGLEGFRV